MAEGEENMKKNIHPEYKECTVTCDCGASFTTKSIKEEIHVESCSECHSFYTGAQGRHKKTSNIEKFNKKYNIEEK